MSAPKCKSKKTHRITAARSRAQRREKKKPSNKVRRDVAGGKRATGHRRKHPIRRPDPHTIRIRPTGTNLTGTAGLLPFAIFLRSIHFDAEVKELFDRLKPDPRTVYPMSSQIRLLMDMAAAGEGRVFGLESLSADPLFVALAGGAPPSLDTVYRDLCGFDEQAITDLDGLVGKYGLAALRQVNPKVVHLDIDTTVECVFGTQEGALPGPNPRYHGRPSYHPILARLEETDTIVGVALRPGDTGFGKDDVPWIERVIDRVREAIDPDAILYVRIDAAGDCKEILDAIARKQTFFVIKAKLTRNLLWAIHNVSQSAWKTTDRDADGNPCEQVAHVDFARDQWPARRYRVVAIRSIDRPSGKQVFLWDDLDYTVQAYITNEWIESPEGIPDRYNLRAGIEPLIGDLKYGWSIGKVPSQVFDANHVLLLVKILTHNLMRRFVAAKYPELLRWRTAWLRRVLMNVPARLLRSGGYVILEVPSDSMLARMLN